MTFGKGKIWYDGKFVEWSEATTHILSHVIHYGSSVFEGMRCYKTPKGSAIFRMKAHIDRLYDSAKIYRMEIPFSKEEFCNAILETVRVNELEECYIRPFVFRGYGKMGVNPLDNPVLCAIAAWEWGEYLGEGVLKKGISVRISSWNRPAPNTFPSLAKAGGNYLNSQLIKMEAIQDGFDEGIALDSYGYVSEGSGENIFMVRNGVIFTPPTSSSILPGITRHSIFVLARDLKIRIEQHLLPREALYIADEVFFTGTAAEVTPITKIDNITIGKGVRGPMTERIQAEFLRILRGETEDRHNWLTYI
ncbi:MAG: branched-chain amino acid transaminase [bacterium]|nr:branched-chain amino acid transaminase [bacterium]